MARVRLNAGWGGGGEMRCKNDRELARDVRYMYQWEGFIVKWDSS